MNFISRFASAVLPAAAAIAFLAAPMQAQTYSPNCPSTDVSDIMKDPVVQAALDKAWVASEEGTADEHEEGGVIEQCRGNDPSTNKRGYYTRVRKARSSGGTRDSLDYTIRPDSPGGRCRTVAIFHTHPGPENDPTYENAKPSPEDIEAIIDLSLPGIIRFGAGPDPTKTTDFAYREKEAPPRKMAWDCTPAPPPPPEPPPNGVSMSATCGEGDSNEISFENKQSSDRKFRAASDSDWLALATPEGEGRMTVGGGQVGTVNLSGMCGDCCAPPGPKQAQVSIYEVKADGSEDLLAEQPVTMGCRPGPKSCGGSSGDPHLYTLDGLRYDFQGVGEFVLTRAAGFEVQARYQPLWAGRRVSFGTAVAARLGPDRVTLTAGSPIVLRINGAEALLYTGEWIDLPGGGKIELDDRTFRIHGGGGLLEVRGEGATTKSLSIRVRAPLDSTPAGLLGGVDGDRTNDMRLSADAQPLAQPLAFDLLYGAFSDAWRVNGETTLFDYGENESFETFVDRTYPDRIENHQTLSAADRAKALAVCRKAGVTGSVNLEDCTLDVAVTGDADYADVASKQPPAEERLQISGDRREPVPQSSNQVSQTADGVTIEAPAKVIASFPIEFKVSGPTLKHNTLCFASVGSAERKCAAQITAGDGAKDEARVLKLLVPNQPGSYELRYITRESGWKTQVRVPIEVRDPAAHVEAPATAPAAGRVKAACVGECSPDNYLTVVPVGSPDDLLGAHAYMSKGPEVTILNLPKEPGEYEVRLLGHRNPRRVFARKPIRIVDPSASAGGREKKVLIAAPAEAFAAHTVEIRVSEPVRGYWIGFAPAGSGNDGQAASPYGARVMNGDEETVKLVVPTIPGEYELRYRDVRGEKRIFERQPFRSLMPKVTIEAPRTAQPRGNAAVRVLGDVGEHMTLTVVPAGSPLSAGGGMINLKQGPEATGTLNRLPAEPGEYEIRCVSTWGSSRVLYAGSKLTIR